MLPLAEPCSLDIAGANGLCSRRKWLDVSLHEFSENARSNGDSLPLSRASVSRLIQKVSAEGVTVPVLVDSRHSAVCRVYMRILFASLAARLLASFPIALRFSKSPEPPPAPSAAAGVSKYMYGSSRIWATAAFPAHLRSIKRPRVQLGKRQSRRTGKSSL